VQDGLDGVLMEVNNISGLPLFQVSSSNEVFVNRGNLTSGVTTATASFAHFTGSFQGDGSQLTNLPSTDPFPFTGDAEITGSLIVSGAAEFRGIEGFDTNVVIGKNATSTSQNSVVIGKDAGISSGGSKNVVIGRSANLANNTLYNVVIGEGAYGSGAGSIAIGQGATAAGEGVAIGQGANVSDYRGIAIGKGATAGLNQLQIGNSTYEPIISASLETGHIILSQTSSDGYSQGGLEVHGSGSTVFEVIGSQGTLFSVSDNLTQGSLFAVKDINGFPLLDVTRNTSSADIVTIGQSNLILDSGSLQVTGSTGISGSLQIQGIADVSASIAAASTTTPAFPFTGDAQITGSLKITGLFETDSHITSSGNISASGNLIGNTGSFGRTELGKSGALNGSIKFNTLHGPSYELIAQNNSLTISGTTGAPLQGFALDSQVENFSFLDGGTIRVLKGLTTGSGKGGGLHIQAQGFNQSNGKKGIFSTDAIGPYIGNSSYGSTGTHGTFRIINGLSSDNDADSGSVTLAEFGDHIKFNLPITSSGNISASGNLIGAGLTLPTFTTNRVPFIGSNGILTTDSGFEYNSTTNQLSVDSLNVIHLTSSFITSSRIHTSGSNIFGDDTTDTQTLIGTTKITGSAQISGSLTFGGAAPLDLYTGGPKMAIDTSAIGGIKTKGVLSILPSADSTYNSRILFGTTNSNMSFGRRADAGLSIRGVSQNYGWQLFGITHGYNNPGSGFHYTTNLPDTTFAENLTISGSGTYMSEPLKVHGSGSSVFEVIGTEGTLFAIDDDLDGTIFSANDRSGLPVLEASASGEVYIGKSPQSLYTTAVISSTTANISQSIYGLSTSSYSGVFVDYTANSGSNARAGSIMAIWNGSNLNFTETTTTDIGNTTDLIMQVAISQSQAQIQSYATTAGYKIKTLIRSI
jgi:hypothetical protein